MEVVGDFVSLRKSGINYKGLCPFHDEKTPSFIVSPTRGTYHCFGCGRGGNAVSFVMEHEQMSYPDALKWLGRKYGIEVVDRQLTDREKQDQSDRESMFIVNEWAATYFENLLHDSADGDAIGMQYFRSRGFRDDIIRAFRLGYDGSNRFALADQAKKEGYKEEFLLRTGLCYATDKGKLVDRFAERVVFPWFGLSGKVVGFSARLLDVRTKGVQQKYVNSPDSDIYHKDHELFGLFQAKKAISREDRVYLVEGQTDVLSMAQCGIENVVANSGTSLSVHQIRLLHRFTSNITLLYDGDEAGQHAALRGGDMLLAEGMKVNVLLLPDGEDPDSMAHKHTAEEFRQYIAENQRDIIDFKMRTLLTGKTSPQQRSEAIDSIVLSISRVANPVLRDTYVHDLHVATKVHEKTLISRMNVFIREHMEQAHSMRSKDYVEMREKSGTELMEGLERLIAQAVLHLGERVVVSDVDDGGGHATSLNVAQYVYYNLQQDSLSFSNANYQKVVTTLAQHEPTEDFRAEQYLINHGDRDVEQTALSLLTDRYQNDPVLATREGLRAHIDTMLTDYRTQYVRILLTEIVSRMNDENISEEEKKILLRQMNDYTRLYNELKQSATVGKK